MKPSKVGQCDLVFGVWLGCASGCVHTRLKVSVHTSYNLSHPGCPKMFLSILTPLTLKSRSNPRQLLHPWQMHPRYKFGDCRSVACRDNADISIFYNALKTHKNRPGWSSFWSPRTVHQYVPLCKISGLCVSVSSGYDLWHHLMSQIHTYRPTDRQLLFRSYV